MEKRKFRKGDIVRYVGPHLGLHNRDWHVVRGERFGAVAVRFGLGTMSLRVEFLEPVT